jgi:hypothetical protein
MKLRHPSVIREYGERQSVGMAEGIGKEGEENRPQRNT